MKLRVIVIGPFIIFRLNPLARPLIPSVKIKCFIVHLKIEKNRNKIKIRLKIKTKIKIEKE